MKENSIEEDIELLQDETSSLGLFFKCKCSEKYKIALEHILSDYKRVLKENEELKKSKITYEKVRDIQEKNKNIVDKNYIPVQKVKDKIEKYKNMLKTCNKAKDIDRIKAINERILELQELLEGGKEKTADELFDDLGLWLERETPFDFEVKNDDDKVIKFNKERREIACFNYYDGFEYLTLQELQAINKKCQELGWLKED